MKGLKMFLQAEIRDKNGKLLKRTRKRLAKSYTRAIIDLLNSFNQNSGQNVTDTSGNTAAFAIFSSAQNNDCVLLTAGASNANFGIQVGSGTDAVTISDHKLKTQILDGNGSGQLSHGSVSVGSVAIVGSSAKYTVARTFTNNSGADIGVTEVALVCSIRFYGGSEAFVLLDRTLLSFTVANGTSGTVTYTLSVSV